MNEQYAYFVAVGVNDGKSLYIWYPQPNTFKPIEIRDNDNLFTNKISCYYYGFVSQEPTL